jgi:hypothetical protein
MFKSGVMDAPRMVYCDSFWDALVLGAMLEEQGVQVRRPDEGVALSMVASGALDAIKAAVAQLHREFPRSGPVVIEGEDRAEPVVIEGEDRAEPVGTESEDRAEDADTVQFAAMEPLAAIPASGAGGITEEVRAQPDIDAQPEPATASADHTFFPARPLAEQRTGRLTRPDVETASPERAPTPEGNARASPAKARTHPPNAAWPKAWSGRHRGITSGVLVVVLLSAGSLAFLLTRHVATAPTTNGHRTAASTEVAIRTRAAAWVAGQVSRTATVSCDRVMCQAVEAHGIPAASVLELRPGQADPLRSSVIVVTAAVRSMIGSRLITADAPAAIASFGAGSMQIDIRVIAPRGAASYSSALRADVQARKSAGSSLLDNPRITMSATARKQLADGQIDSRLIVAIAGLAADRPVSIVAFGGLPPGASPGIPFRSADLAPAADTAGPTRATDLRWMSDFLRAQRARYRAAHITVVPLAEGRNILHVEFAAPSPLGLLNPKTP